MERVDRRRQDGLECRRAARRGAIALLALAGCARCTEPAAPVPEQQPVPLFHEVSAARGIDFVHHVTADGQYRIAEIIGPGCAAFDANGDGRVDLLFADSGDGPGAGRPNRLYVQQQDGSFVDGTAASGLGDPGFGTGFAVADVDNDGDLDVFVGNWGSDALYVNDGGRFSRSAVLGPPEGLTTSAAFLDFDLDGHLDLFVTHYVVPLAVESCDGGRSRIRDYCVPAVYPPAGDTLYRNRGDGTFEDVTIRAGIGDKRAPGLAVTVDDLDEDGRPDIYVANDGRANHAWINAGDGTFHDVAVQSGLAYNGLGAAEASMGIATGDVDGDGERDLVLSHLRGETNTVYRRLGSVGYEDASGRSGVAGPSVPHTGWGIALFDIECDGDLDLAVANGAVGRTRRGQAPGPTPWERYAEQDHVLLNDGAGSFSIVESGLDGVVGVGRALVPVDLDRDGDMDLVITNIAGHVQVYENVAPRRGQWLRVRCIDPGLRRDAYGARVEVRAGGATLVRTIAPASSYLSSGEAAAQFGLGDAVAVDEVTVVWPGGDRERFSVGAVDCEVVLERGKGVR